jgi:hypothetical protein
VLQAGNSIGDRGAEMIAEGLKVNRKLIFLNLVRRFYHYFALDVFLWREWVSRVSSWFLMFLIEERSLSLVCCRLEIV